jgi:hypothetical protein
MTRKRLFLAGWVLVLGLSATLPLSALFHGILHLGTHPIKVHGVLKEPLISVGADVDLYDGSQAPAIVIGGNLRLHGRAADDLVVIGGGSYLLPHSRVDGDVLSLIGGIYRARGVVANGRLGGALHQWNGTASSGRPSAGTLVTTNIRLGLAAGFALLLVGTCLAIVFPWQVVLIATTLRSDAFKSMAAGVMNLVIFVFLVVPLGLSLAGLPFAMLLSGAAFLAWLFGLTASAVVLGRLLSRGTVSLVSATAAGLAVIACSMAVPLIGPLAITAVGLAGTGALAVALISRSRPAAPLS